MSSLPSWPGGVEVEGEANPSELCEEVRQRVRPCEERASWHASVRGHLSTQPLLFKVRPYLFLLSEHVASGDIDIDLGVVQQWLSFPYGQF